MMNDVFGSNIFSLTAMTAAISQQPYTPTMLADLALFEEEGINTTTAIIEFNINPIPEPSTYVSLIGVAALMIAAVRPASQKELPPAFLKGVGVASQARSERKPKGSGFEGHCPPLARAHRNATVCSTTRWRSLLTGNPGCREGFRHRRSRSGLLLKTG